MVTKEESLAYHEFPKAGKLCVESTVPFMTQKDLALAYTPGVANPCIEIQQNEENAFKYTSKSNLVAVISNGTAVLGLGDIGALASKPVMEGKSILFKRFSSIDSFDIEVNEKDVDRFCTVVEAIAPTFGGINLEDIAAPACFAIEERLTKTLDIPVMHDDQHGTAIISSAALINACEISNRTLQDIKIVVVGAGAAAIACSKMYKSLGVENIIMIDSKGVISKNRDDLNAYKKEFAVEKPMSIEEAFFDADMVLGLSKPGTFTKEHIALMADEPIVFALANPTPELFPDEIKSVKPKAMIGTGRSDFNNQINNVLGFPFIFRGALDVRATSVNMEMKKAAAYAIANLAKKEPTQEVKAIFGENIAFGREHIIPKPFDKRLMVDVSSAVALAAIDSGVARITNIDFEAYKLQLAKMVGL
jgi:malate dehydrogenase (oxaloacetate-decarboxylating)/malate dehydrogenase (oxaloacetate-decarboxylating)(NADP+)